MFGAAVVASVCSLLTQADIPYEQARESVKRGGAITLTQCYYAMKVASDSIVLEVASAGPDAKTKHPVRELWNERLRKEHRQEEEEELRGEQRLRVRGVGEEAFWVRSKAGALYVLTGERWLKVSLGGPQSEKVKIARARRLARLALKRLGRT